MDNNARTFMILAIFIVSALLTFPVTGEESRQYLTHTPIVITGDAGFTAANGVVEGSGTEMDPYQISGWEIETTSTSAITITGTTKYFEVQFCKLKGGGTSNAGLTLTNVKNGDIEHNDIMGNFGMRISNSDTLDISYNTFVTTEQGILADNLKTSEMDYNDFSGYLTAVTINGATPADSSDNQVDYNTFNGGNLGVHLNKVTATEVDYNTFTNVKKSLKLDTVSGSDFDYNNFFGGTTGAEIISGTDVSGDYNEFKDHTSHALVITGITSSSFNENNFINNNGANKQAMANGVDLMTDIDNNYWDDWTTPDADSDGFVDVPYDLEGGELSDEEPYADPVPGAGYDVPPTLTVTASGNPTSGDAPLSVSFTGSASGGVSPYTYLWDFGDGSTGTQATATHSYTDAGTYMARLTAVDSAFQSKSSAAITVTVTEVVDPLGVSITTDTTSGDAPLAVAFSSSVTGGVTPYTYSWDMGDGTTKTDASFTYTYNTAGTYTVTLTVTDGQSTAKTASVTITADEPIPEMTLTFSPSKTSGKAPLKVDFTSAVTGGTGSYVYVWDFGDGGAAAEANPTHTFKKKGTYTVKLLVTDTALNVKEYTTTIEVKKETQEQPGFELVAFVFAVLIVAVVMRRRK